MEQRAEFAKRLLNTKPAMVLGRYRNPYRGGEPVYLYDASDGFVGMYYPTRTGKGISFVIPNGFVWPHSLFYSDPKVETIKLVGAYRRYALGNRIFVISPNRRDSWVSRYNFLDEIRIATFFEIPDAYNLATAIVDPTGTGFSDPKEAIWKRRSRDLLSCFILHILYAREFPIKSLPVVIDFLTDPGASFEAKLVAMKQYQHDPDGRFGWKDVHGNLTRTHPYIAAKLQEQSDRGDSPEAQGVLSEARSYLSYYQSPIVRENCATSDFSMRDLMDGPVPTTTSLAIPPDELEAAQPFLRLFLNLMINRNLTDIEPDPITLAMKPAHQWKLAMILDEFSIFGRLDLFAKQLAFIAGYGMKAATVVQDIQQIKADYSSLENLTSNTSTMMFSRMNNTDSAEYFSKKILDRTIGHYGTSESVTVGVNPSASFSTNYSTMGRRLFTPSEIESMHNDFAVLKQSGRPPAMIEKLHYYQDDSRFAHMIASFADERSDVIPYEEQQARVNLREQQAEYLAWCRQNGGGITERLLAEERRAEEQSEKVRSQRERYIEEARLANGFAFAA